MPANKRPRRSELARVQQHEQHSMETLIWNASKSYWELRATAFNIQQNFHSSALMHVFDAID